jgi:hypothetical protein
MTDCRRRGTRRRRRRKGGKERKARQGRREKFGAYGEKRGGATDTFDGIRSLEEEHSEKKSNSPKPSGPFPFSLLSGFPLPPLSEKIWTTGGRPEATATGRKEEGEGGEGEKEEVANAGISSSPFPAAREKR